MSKHLVFDAHVPREKCSLIDDCMGAKITGKYPPGCNFCDIFFQNLYACEIHSLTSEIVCRGNVSLDTAFWHSTPR